LRYNPGMENIDKIYRLDKLLGSARSPISIKRLMNALYCSESTVRRVITTMQNRFNAPIEYDRLRNGWHYCKDKGAYSLPGFWLNDQEIYGLLAMQQLLGNFDPELLHDEIAPIETRLREIISKTTGLNSTETLGNYIRLLPYNRRDHQYSNFQTIASAKIPYIPIHLTVSVTSNSLRLIACQCRKRNWMTCFFLRLASFQDGAYVLRIPYSHATELIGEILRFGDGVTVLEPPELRAAVREKLQKMLGNYGCLVTV